MKKNNDFKYCVMIILTQIGMLTVCFYPFYRWDSQIRGTPIEYIFEPGYAGHGTFLLAILYSIMNLRIFYYYNGKKNKEIEELKKQLQNKDQDCQ